MPWANWRTAISAVRPCAEADLSHFGCDSSNAGEPERGKGRAFAGGEPGLGERFTPRMGHCIQTFCLK
jgi:hypothetical protein